MSLQKVLVITYYWPPSGGAGVQRALKFVKYFREFGYEPVVLTVDPAKASYPVIDQTLLNEVSPDIRVITTDSFEPLNILSAIMGKKNVPYGGFANANKESKTQKILRWVRGNFFIPDARVGWVSHAVKAATKLIEAEGINYVFVSSPPHSSQLIGLQLKQRYPQLRWIADMRDPWTDIYYYKDLLHTPTAAAKDAGYERKVLESADEIIVVSEAIKRTFTAKSAKINAGKVHVIPNGYDENDFAGEVKPEANAFVVSYVGTMADTYKPDVFFKAFAEVVKKHPQQKVRFRFIGNAPWTLKKLTEDYGIDSHCEWIGHVNHDEAIHYMRTSDMLLLIIPDSKGAEGILTGKLFEYLGAERTILGIGPVNGDAAKIIQECNAGKMFERGEGNIMRDWLDQEVESVLRMETIYNGNGQVKKFRRRELTRSAAAVINGKQG
jgi:glycosyltransferase involved in cell wall biosynthesis